VAINEKDEAVVGADADAIAGGDRRQSQCAAEVENDGLAQGRGGMGDPGSGPVPLRWVGLNGGLSLQGEAAESESEKGKKLAQGIGPSVEQTPD
jgi:hypothetical protein